MQEWGFTPEATNGALRRANNKRLLETPQRVTFDEDESGLYGEIPDCFRVSTIGMYHYLRWITEFSYLDAMSYDTPILEGDIREEMIPKIGSFSIANRLDRALTFRRYLTKVWHSSKLAPAYFDWTALVKTGEQSFARVKRAVEGTAIVSASRNRSQ